MRKRILAMIMAGGRGTRLFPLTRDRAKPAVPFGGKFRIMDWVLSNFINSGIYSIYVLTQFKSQSLNDHLRSGWGNISMMRDHFITPVPAQMRTGDSWYKGTADAIYQNLNLIREGRPHYVAVFGGDHIYRMDVSQMIGFHDDVEADVTVAAISVPIEEASQFGVISIDREGLILKFEEKPENPTPMPGDPTRALVSMGNYIFSCRTLCDSLEKDAVDESSSHDFGNDLLPRLLDNGQRLYCYDFEKNIVPGEDGRNTYWRDVGTLEAYFDATMDLRDVIPGFNLYNASWPIRTAQRDLPPAKFIHDDDARRGHAINSLISEGSIVSGAKISGSVLGRNVRIHSHALVEDCIIFDDVEIGRDVQIRRAIVDKNVRIPEGEIIGHDIEADRERFFVSEEGIVILPKQALHNRDLGVLNL